MAGLAWNVAAGSQVAGALRIVLPMLVYMIGIGLILPSALAGAIGPFPRRAGAASALLGFTQMGTAAVLGGVIGLLMTAPPGRWPAPSRSPPSVVLLAHRIPGAGRRRAPPA